MLSRFCCLFLLCCFWFPAWAGTAAKLPEGVFADIAGEQITVEEYHVYHAEKLRQRFYHGKIPEAELAAFEKEIAQQLIDHVLLAQEAKRRELVVDGAEIDELLAHWQAARGGNVPEEVIQQERRKRYGDKLVEALRQEVEGGVALPAAEELRGYYEANPSKFTRPERLKLSLILLKVAPYEQAGVWQAAYDTAQGVLDRINGGESFVELAKQFSEHESSVNGGDLGFVHSGMLSSEVQEIVKNLNAGGMVEKPVVLLQGVALLRLEERYAPALVSYAKAKQRVEALLLREKREQAWGSLLQGLREKSSVVLMER